MKREFDDHTRGTHIWARLRCVVVAIICLAAPSAASAVPLGILSFDTLIPPEDNGGIGVNAFNIYNLTGAFGLPPDFPVVDSLTFVDAELTAARADGTTTFVELGDVGPGFADNAGLLFPDTDTFLSATLTFTLSSLQFLLEDGSTFEAASSLVSVSLLPTSVSFLAPGDLVVIDVAAAPTTVPEPSTALLFGSGFLLWCSARRRRMKAS
jgi:hypothetical protein